MLFDLGGVLIDFAGVSELSRLLPTGSTDADVKARWLACPHSEAFGRGLLETEVFAERFVADWGVPLRSDRFLAEFRSWARGWLPGAVELLAELRPRFRLAVLSNCNPAHWDRLLDDFGVTAHVDAALSSHHLGLRKPDPAIYEAALDHLGVPAGDVLFFDDAAANVEAAIGIGMQAVVVDGPDAVRRCLVDRAWIPG